MSEQPATLDVLNEWRTYCLIQCQAHNKMRSIYKHRNYALAVPAILLSTIGGAANISVGANNCNNSISWLSVLFGTIGLTSAAMFSIHRYLHLPELQKEHDIYADEFEKLSNEITLQLTLDHEKGSQAYRNLAEFMKECKRSMDVLIDKAPPIFASVEENIKKQLT